MFHQSHARKSFDPLTVSRLPARLDADHTARLLGFATHDIPILVNAKLLHPLGKPQPNAVKYFVTTTLEELRSNESWLDAATKAVSQHWRHQNRARRDQEPSQDVHS